MNGTTPTKDALADGARLLARPLLPLVHILQFLYLTGPFTRVEEVIAELREPVETAGVRYEQPDELLTAFLPTLKNLERLKDTEPLPWRLTGQDGAEIGRLEAVGWQVAQQVAELELEQINSLLCGPCQCTLCCIGPDRAMRQEFFEIPLSTAEAGLFPVENVDTGKSRTTDSAAEPPLLLQGRPFYQQATPLVIHWQTGPSLILPRASRCPQLSLESDRCLVYDQRPRVCRRPQIFAYITEPSPLAETGHQEEPPVHILREKILAVWDCPYVRLLHEEIGVYAETSGLTPVFAENKG